LSDHFASEEKLIRLTDPKEIEALLKSGKVNDQDKRSVNEFLKSTSKKQKKAPATVCVLPPEMPADRLYQALATEFGLYRFGGDLVHELTLSFTGRKFRIDSALPAYAVAIEMDGYAYHGKPLEGFKRDRAKQRLMAKYGWIMIRVTNEEVNNSLSEVIADIKQCVSFRQRWVEFSITETSFGRHDCPTNPIKRIEKDAI
jgi:hypothetical protein